MTRGGLAIILAAALGAAPQAMAAPTVTEVIEYYDVEGSTPQEIRGQLDRLGPVDSTEGRRRDGRTRWFVNWRYNYNNAASSCSISGVSITVKITITLPRLRAGSSTPATVRQAFETYTGNLLVHEKGHVQNGIDIAKRIEERIASVPSHPTCERLGQAANELGNSLVREANRQDVEYDARTQHGRTQGAHFP